jgi:protein-S-isoprenylcysteine O-methyltransferase Ste14
MKPPSFLKYLRDIIIFPFTVTAIIPYFLYNRQQSLIPENIYLKTIAIILFIGGLLLFLSTNYLFVTIAKGTLAPWSPKQNLVVQGPYRYCRNPMITGVLFILFAEALYFHSTNILIWGCFFFLMNTVYFIKVEEPHLLKTFGEQYKIYKANVPRWLPRFTPYNP